jgi:hypothetical protein
LATSVYELRLRISDIASANLGCLLPELKLFGRQVLPLMTAAGLRNSTE